MNETPLSLLARLRQQPDDTDWRHLVTLYTPVIHGWLRRYHFTQSDADDVIQEVLSIVVKEIGQFEHSQRPGAFRHWLRSVTVNRLRGYWRTQQQKGRATQIDQAELELEQLADPNSVPSRQWDHEHNEHVVRQLLTLLEPEFTPPTWHAFTRQVMDGIKPAEVAQELGLTVNAVIIAKSRVLRRLRQEGAGMID